MKYSLLKTEKMDITTWKRMKKSGNLTLNTTTMVKDTKWSIDHTHSEISFKARHLVIANVRGTFKTFEANIYTKAKDFKTAEIDLWIDAASISTGDARRDEHLKSADFFDVQNHRQITFTANTIGSPDINGNHELWGELTIKGFTKRIKLRVKFGGIINDPFGNEKAGFSVIGKINRKDWGLTWNQQIETGGLVVSDEVIIACEMELINVGEKELKMELEHISNNKNIL